MLGFVRHKRGVLHSMTKMCRRDTFSCDNVFEKKVFPKLHSLKMGLAIHSVHCVSAMKVLNTAFVMETHVEKIYV